MIPRCLNIQRGLQFALSSSKNTMRKMPAERSSILSNPKAQQLKQSQFQNNREIKISHPASLPAQEQINLSHPLVKTLHDPQIDNLKIYAIFLMIYSRFLDYLPKGVFNIVCTKSPVIFTQSYI